MSNKPVQVLCRALVRNINPVSGKYTYPKEEFTFTIGKGYLKEIPKHWEKVKGNAVVEAPSEVETLMDMQIKNMTVGRIAQFMMIYYGIKIDLGQHQETAYRQAITFIRDPSVKRRPDSEICAGLAAIENDTPEKESGPAEIPSGKPNPVVPSKDEENAVVTDSKENAAGNGKKLFKDMNADDIDGLDVKNIIPLVQEMYGVEMANSGNKTVRLNKALEIEAAALAAKETTILERDK